ncbi:MAG: di-trans,poly-cis-decaprenylcistransferase [Ruminococcus sp.]|nr:di-trans,poly-cis-decaprenylcistransferase [Ruminococcus sp.]
MAFLNKKSGKSNELPEILPEHIGFIMDGNGRWAKRKGLPRSFGHREGAKNFKKIVRYCKDIGIKNISFYAFSTENWKRPQEEIDVIMDLFREYIVDVRKHLSENTRMIFLGDKSVFDEDLREKMIKLEEDTKHYTEMNLMMAVNYGGRDELAYAARQLAQKVKDGKINPEDIDENAIDSHLYTKGIPDVDLIIRPSEELRLSNFLIWQSAYAEYYFTEIMWPDFTPKELDKAIIEFANRGRRFGGV